MIVIENPRGRDGGNTFVGDETHNQSCNSILHCTNMQSFSDDSDALTAAADELNDMPIEEEEPVALPLPVISVSPGNLNAQVKQLEKALTDRVYQRGSNLVQVITLPHDVETHGIRGRKGTSIIDVITADTLTLLGAQCATWEKKNKEGKWTSCNPDPTTVRALLAARGQWCLPYLRGIINCPVILKNGGILTHPGYDASTGLFGVFHASDFPDVVDHPSLDDAIIAKKKLDDLLSEFPFVEQRDHSVALAAILSGVVDSSVKKPLFCFNASTAGTGKSTLADIVSIIATGTPAPALSFVPDETELRKTIFAALLEGAPVLLIDNVSQDLKSDSLNIALTQRTFMGRILGRSETGEVPSESMWLVTGNNLTISGDLTRRTLICTLDAQVERPSQRKFQRDIYKYAQEHRGVIVNACVSILRAHVIAGCPGANDMRPLNSFNDWSTLIRGALLWINEPDPLDSQLDLEDNDPERTSLINVLSAWHDCYASHAIATTDILDGDENNPAGKKALLIAIKESVFCRGPINSKVLGKWFSKNKGRIVNGLRIIKRVDSSKRCLWSVEKV